MRTWQTNRTTGITEIVMTKKHFNALANNFRIQRMGYEAAKAYVNDQLKSQEISETEHQETIYGLTQQELAFQETVDTVCSVCKQANPLFDRTRFWEAVNKNWDTYQRF